MSLTLIRVIDISRRLDEANEQSLQYQNEMKAHKQNAVHLEKLVGKLRLESGAPSKVTSGTDHILL